MKIVEIGIKLDENFEYYDELLKSKGFINDYTVKIHDIYYTNKDLEGLSENQMKNGCIRLRSFNGNNFIIQNDLSNNHFEEKELSSNKLKDFEGKLYNLGFKKVFDTKKWDFHYSKVGMSNKIQLQQIENIGLLVYFDNKEYYRFEVEVQRKKLINELNLYGFNFNDNTLGLDKLRTLYYGKEMFSKNQND